MQWHPIFAHLLRPLVESDYEVRTDQPVGDLPRQSDVVLLRKAAAGPAPFRGLWSRLTTWSVLEYKGPTVSARLAELHDLVELGLGIHRRLNELQAKEGLAGVEFQEVSFWYLVNHMGRRFLADLPAHLPGVQQEAERVWRATVFRHPLFLVSVREVAVERDSLPLHVLAGVPEEAKRTVADVLKAEPALWASYKAWLLLNEPAIWQEVLPMTAQHEPRPALDLRPFIDYLKETNNLRRFLEAMGAEQMWAQMSPEQREALRKLAEQDRPPETGGQK